MKRIKDIEPGIFPEESFAGGYADYIENILDRAAEPLVWSLIAEGRPRIDKIVRQGSDLAERLRPKWRTAADGDSAILESLPDWAVDLFERCYVGRQAAFLGALEKDEACFAVLFLHAMFTVQALQRVCQRHPALARKYASRCAAWPWFVSSVHNFNKKLRRQLEAIGFASRTSGRHKAGSAANKPESTEIMAMLLWMRLVADCWDPKQAAGHPLLSVLQAMPDRAGKNVESIASIIGEAVQQFAKEMYTTKLRLPYGKYPSRTKKRNERDLAKTVRQLVHFMLRPPDGSGARTKAGS